MALDSSNYRGMTCLLCFERDCHAENDVEGRDLYVEFIKFCAEYLRVNVAVVNILRASELKEGTPGSATRTETFCRTCKPVVQATLKTFAEWSELRVKLLGNVDRLGRLIGNSSGIGCRMGPEVANFRKEVENKCFTKAQIIQPSILLFGNKVPTVPGTSNAISSKDNEPSHVDYDCGSSESIYSPFCSNIMNNEADADNSNRRTDSRKDENIISAFQTPRKRSRAQSALHKIRRRRGRPRKAGYTDDGTDSRQINLVHKCPECSFETKRKADVFEHRLTAHEGIDMNKFLQCSVCQVKSQNVADLQRHLDNEHNRDSKKANIYCVYCSMSFTTEQQRDLHRRFDHPKYPHVMCEVNECSEIFMSIPDYNEHLKSHCLSFDEKISYCEECGRGFLNASYCRLHKFCHMLKNEEGFYQCSIEECNTGKYKNVTKLMNHFNKKHFSKEEQVELHRCDVCKESPFYIFRKELKIHLKNHVQKVQCRFCKQSFMGHNNLMVHHFNKHPDKFKGALVASQRQPGLEIVDDPPTATGAADGEEITIYRTCAYCSKKFLSFQELEKHKFKEHQIHVIALPAQVQCEVCGLEISKSMLARHMTCHKDPHIPCPHHPCTRKFRREENLTMHIKKVHDRKDSDREFVCDACGKRYLSQGLLNRHVKEQHVKPFPCHLCPKTFSTVGRVNEHLRASHTNEKFQCQWCPNQYGWLVKLKLHAKKKHPEHAHLVNSIYNHGMKPKSIEYLPPSKVQKMDVGDNIPTVSDEPQEKT